MTTNFGKSVRTRLLNTAREEKHEYMKVLVRYLHERLLYRISISAYKPNFLLKGSSLLFAYDKFKARPTIDIDLLGKRISNDNKHLLEVFRKICAIEYREDGVTFDNNSLILSPIAIEKKYPGTCVTVTAHLDTIIQPISIDIGYGDVVTPYPLLLDYPVLLDNMPTFELFAYSLETLIAEKFHTMVDRDESNSRMKDFFDIYYVFKNHKIDNDILREAIHTTFKNRGTNYHESLKLFTTEFANDATRNVQWTSFLRKIRWKEEITFPIIMDSLRGLLSEFWNESISE